MEGGTKISKIIKYLVKKKIPVMGHVGLLPQTAVNFKVKGKNLKTAQKIIIDFLNMIKNTSEINSNDLNEDQKTKIMSLSGVIIPA